jgi:hypothetical protein
MMAWWYELREGSHVWYLTEAEYKNLRVRLDRIFATAKVFDAPENPGAALSIAQFLGEWRRELSSDGVGIRGLNETKILDAVEFIARTRLLDLKEGSR